MLAEKIRRNLVHAPANKKLGQHFMINEKFLERQAEVARLTSSDKVLEVGPGFGFLTEKLSSRARVIAVEKDSRFAPYLEGLENVEIIWGDVLEVDVPAFTRVVSNLPYQISSPFTFWLLERKFDVAVLTYQEEFAKRMTKTDNRLGMSLSFIANVEILQKVPKTWFIPQPDVNSALVKITPKNPPKNWKELTGLIQKLYQQPKKTVKNAIKGLNVEIPEKIAEKRVRRLSQRDIVEINSYIKV